MRFAASQQDGEKAPFSIRECVNFVYQLAQKSDPTPFERSTAYFWSYGRKLVTA